MKSLPILLPRRLVRAVGALLCLAATLALPAFGERPDPAKLRATGYVNDFAGVIEPDWQQKLTRLATVVEQKTKAQIAIVTLQSLEGEPIEDFANRLFAAWGIGHKDDRGLLLLLVIRDRRSRLEVGYGLEPIIPDGFSGSVLREMRPALRDAKYGEALYAGTALLAERIAAESGVKLDSSSLPQAPRRGTQGPNWVAIVIVLAALAFGVPWWIIMINAGYTRRYRSGGWGAFGGYDSGGSGGGFGGFGGGGGFGGFGGGSSGGGGASSSW